MHLVLIKTVYYSELNTKSYHQVIMVMITPWTNSSQAIHSTKHTQCSLNVCVRKGKE